MAANYRQKCKKSKGEFRWGSQACGGTFDNDLNDEEDQ
jgi:hypothetical protein